MKNLTSLESSEGVTAMQDGSLTGDMPDPQPEPQLDKWQKRQATLLYHFASMDYLKGLKKLVDDFVNGVDITLDVAQRQGRDRFLVSERWGVRDTVANFSTYGFPALQEFQRSVSRGIALRATEFYDITGYNQCFRLLRELSMSWSTPEEEERFDAGMDAIGKYRGPLDITMRRAWSDDLFNTYWHRFSELFPRWPKFRVRIDVEAESGRLPIRTGVYVPQNDPYGCLQFAWTGDSDGRLSDCSTFNALGLQAIAAVGREGLWTHDHRLLRVVREPRYLTAFKAQRNVAYTTQMDHLNDPGAAAAFISRAGIETRPCKWYYVEPVEGEFEDPEPDAAPSVPCVPLDSAAEQVLLGELVATGQICPQTGWWQSADEGDVPDGRRHLDAGEPMPHVLARGKPTLWQRFRHERPLQRRETIWEFVAWDDCAAGTETGNIEASPGD